MQIARAFHLRRAGLGGLLAELALSVPLHAKAVLVVDPAGDFVTGYTGPPLARLDVRSSEVTLDLTQQTLAFTGTMDGDIGSTLPGYYVWGIDRGAGVEVFNADPPPHIGVAS